MEWDFACTDWETRLREGRSIVPDLPLNDAEATRAVAIFNKLCLPDVPGQPLLLDTAGEWQRDIVRALFGSLVGQDRMVPELFCMVPKKNSKTTGGAAITVTALLMNDRPRAEFIYVGPTQEVADLAFQQTVGMIEADAYLSTRFHIQAHTKTITDRRNKSRLKVKTFDMKVVTGSKPTWVLLDEVHLMATINGAARIVGQIRGGMLPNPEAILVMITTQSDQPPVGVFKAEMEYARGVRDGRIKGGRVLPMIYEMPRAMQADPLQWRDPKNWPMVLPNLGRSITLPRLIADYTAAAEKGPEEERRWASQHLNLEIGLALHSNRWAGAPFWEGRADKRVTYGYLLEHAEVITAGVDGGGLDDLLGLCLIGRHRDTGEWMVWVRAWAHPTVLEQRKSEAERFRDFEADGDLVLVTRMGDDTDEVGKIIGEVFKAGLLNMVGLDPAGIGSVLEAIAAAGVPCEQGEKNCKVVGISQGWKLNSAIKTAERKLAGGVITHGDQPLMAWCVGNAKVEPKGNAVVITKEVSGTGKIDPVMAFLNAVELMGRNPSAEASYQVMFA